MRIAKEDVEIKMQIPGAVIRQRTDFGDTAATARSAANISPSPQASIPRRFSRDWKAISASVPIGVSCCAGELTTTDANGQAGDGHRARPVLLAARAQREVDADAEIVMFSPQHEHSHVINHMIDQVNGYA